ncbi:MAG: hypothetical protein ACREUT_11475 [Steroidobacteraceae bacterium]
MKIKLLSTEDFWKAIAIGVASALLLTAVMLPAFKFDIAPMPKFPSLALAEVILGRAVPLPIGLFFHIAYVTFWSVVYVALFRDRMTFLNALWLALTLWVVLLVVFFPIVGWGFLGLGIGVKLIPAGLAPHLLFAFFLWGLCRLTFKPKALEAVRS